MEALYHETNAILEQTQVRQLLSNLYFCTWLFSTCIQGSVFRSENDIYPSPPLLKIIFFPLSWHVILDSHRGPFCLNSSPFCIYFTLLLPLFSFSFPFLPFLLHFWPFSLSLFIFFPPNDIGWYFLPPPRGGGIFQYIDPCMYPVRSN